MGVEFDPVFGSSVGALPDVGQSLHSTTRIKYKGIKFVQEQMDTYSKKSESYLLVQLLVRLL